jgi:hypothetical protein
VALANAGAAADREAGVRSVVHSARMGRG